MPSFSNRRGVPTRGNETGLHRRGRRSGNPPTCRARLRGWLRNVCRRSPIWGDVDIKAFCAVSGYSREHATRELSRIRREESEFAFETKQRQKNRRGRKRWGVIVTDPRKLLFDRRSLFFDRKGRPLHNYTALTRDGEQIPPTIARPRLPTASSQQPQFVVPEREQHSARVCDNGNIRKNYFVIQQPNLYGAKRGIASSRVVEKRPRSKPIAAALRRRAFCLVARLARCHWDNCKVLFSRRAGFSYAFRALADGHEQERILTCYEKALFVCHGFAVDQAASSGKATFFNASSTIKKARAFLALDGLSRSQRVSQWYAKNRNSKESALAFEPDPDELAAIRAQIAATFPTETSTGFRS